MQAPPFLPDELGEWLGALSVIGTFVGVTYRYGRKTQQYEDEVKKLRDDMEERLQTRGERMGGVEDRISRMEGRVEAIHATQVTDGLEVRTNSRDLTAFGAQVQGLRGMMEEIKQEMSEMHGDLRERLARIEERTNGRIHQPKRPPL